MNRVTLFGRLGKDPELKQAGGTSILKFSLATSERKKQGEQWIDHTEWHSVVVFGKRAEALSRLLAKGSRVLVEGKLRTSSWEKDGQKQYKTEVIADDVELLDGKRDAAPRRAAPTSHDATEDGHRLDWDADDVPF